LPARSRKQQRYIFYLRNKYKSPSKTPEKYKWIWKKEWERLEEAKKRRRRRKRTKKPYSYYGIWWYHYTQPDTTHSDNSEIGGDDISENKRIRNKKDALRLLETRLNEIVTLLKKL